jgi:hypothetical protein
LILLALLATLWRVNQPPPPDPRMVALAARATLYALPTPTPQQIVVTQVVVVTQIVIVTATPIPPPTPLPTATITPTATVAPTQAPPAADAQPALAVAPPPLEAASVSVGEAAQPAEKAALVEVDAPSSDGCPAASSNQYNTIPVAGGGLDHPADQHADLRLALRTYQPVDAARTLIDKDGPVDGDPPQLAGIFGANRSPQFGQPYQVHDWDWACDVHGCRGALLDWPEVTLVALNMQGEAAVRIPRRGQQIYGGGYKALLLYAEPTGVTLGYTREDSVANGYVVHIENFCVDPNLLALYAGSQAAGRSSLPALREDEPLGLASLGEPLVAVRDRGAFLDPRSRLDWWHGQ